MIKSRREPESCKKQDGGYLTVYLTLILAALIPFYLLLIDGARYNGAKFEAVCAVDAGMKSIMAEYSRALYNRYHILAIDSSYGNYASGKYNTEAHLLGYIRKNLNEDKLEVSKYVFRDFFGLSARDAQIQGVRILSDENGAVFRREAVRIMKEETGLDLYEKVKSWTTFVSISGFDTADYEAEKDKADEELMTLIKASKKITESDIYDENTVNPTEVLNQNRRKGILYMVFSDTGEISNKQVNTSSLIGYRMKMNKVSIGNMDPEEEESAADKFFFDEYLLRYLGCYGDTSEGSALDYEVEYLLCGCKNDTDNLRMTANKLLLLREAANVAYLKGNAEKMLDIQAVATVTGAVLLSPELEPAIEKTLLLGWAYAESVYDVKNLFAGNRVPLIKDDSSWHYHLTEACGGANDEAASKWNGLDYKDYLRIFLLLADTDKITLRAMDMVEADMRLTEGNRLFRIDSCYTNLITFITVESSFGYDFTALRQGEY